MIDLSRTYYWHSNSSGSDGAGWGIWRNGWSGSLSAVQTALDAGINKLIVRGPEGDTDRAWPLDFYVPSTFSRRLKAAEVRKFCRHVTEMGMVRSMMYHGSLPHDRTMKPLQDAGNVGAWLWRVLETIRPSLDAGWKDIAFDHVGAYGGQGTPSYHMLRTIQGLGVNVYGEPHGDPIYGLHGCVVTDEHWQRANSDEKLRFRDNYTGHVIRICYTMDQAKAVLDESDHSAALTWRAVNELRAA